MKYFYGCKRRITFLHFFYIISLFLFCGKTSKTDYPITPVPFTEVKITDNFWSRRIETNNSVTIPFAFKKIEETGRLDNFVKGAGKMPGRYEGRRFNDSDVFKVIEGASYSLNLYPDKKLEKYLDSLISIIGDAQEEDGYLYAARTAHPDNPAPGAGAKRWIHLQGSHELYNAGHLYEAAVAHFQATGKQNLLDIALKNADLITEVFGQDKRHDTPGHQEIEIGLAKLYRITGDRKYLNLAKFFLDQRGKSHDSEPYPDSSVYAIYNGRKYRQDHTGVLEQEEAVGHAVRATYMYAGMADIAALTGNREYIQAIDRIWENAVTKKIYLTGGVGARHTSEAFGDNYELPNLTAYTETCTAVGNVLWNHRMFLLHGDAKYIDVLERTLYNGLISGVSLGGDRFFYQNPLESKGGYKRSEWFVVSCCPGNIVRFIPSIPGYIYAVKDDILYINLFIGSLSSIKTDDYTVKIRQETEYPWDGKVKFSIDPETSGDFEIRVRIPGWAKNQLLPGDLYRYVDKKNIPVEINFNGGKINPEIKSGYACIRRVWNEGDILEINLPMPVRYTAAHDSVADNRNKIALERGSIVYCIEEADNGRNFLELELPDNPDFSSDFNKNLLNGITTLKGEMIDNRGKKHIITAIPYYAWAHRGAGKMAVWLKE